MPADPTKDQDHAHAEPADRPDAGGPVDRRRPGRLHEVSPALIDLLRSRSTVDLADAGAGSLGPGQRDEDEWGSLGPARGILLATVVGAGLWAGLYWIIKYSVIGLLLH